MNRRHETNGSPPRWADQLLEWYCNPHLLEEVQGDLHELYGKWVEQYGVKKARWLYVVHVIQFFRPYTFKRISINNPTDMFKNYFIIAFRTLLKQKLYPAINILGLSIGMGCCLVIFQYLAFEYSFDNFNKNALTLYRVNQTMVQGGGEPTTGATTGWALGPALAQEVPEIERFVRLHAEYNNAIVSNPNNPDKSFEEEAVYYADSTFFQIFSYPLIWGNPERALAEPGTVLLSASAAKKYFGQENPLGKVLDISGWIKGSYRIDGIFQDVPVNSHLQFDILLPMIDLLQKSQFNNPSTGWGWRNFMTYIQLHTGAERSEVEQKVTNVLLRYQGKAFQQNNTTASLDLQPLTDIHLNDQIPAPRVVKGSYQTVYFFLVIGLITLVIALVNYVNLATARSLNRAREVGIRKVIGAKRRQLIIQFLTESGITILTAFLLAIVLADVLIPFVNNLGGTHLPQGQWLHPVFWVVLFGIFCLTTLLAGLYPAFVLSSFTPGAVLKGKISKFSGSSGFRRGMVVLQFTASIVLLIGTGVVYTQLHYMRNLDLGLNLDQIMILPRPRVFPAGTQRDQPAKTFSTFTSELQRIPGVLQTGTSSTVPGKGFSLATNSIRKATDPTREITGVVTEIDTGFARVYGLELIAGEGFKNISIPPSEDEPRPVIANESAIRALDFESPEDAIGQYIDAAGNKGRLVGVFKDFNWSSAHQERENAFFFLEGINLQISIKVRTKNLPSTIAATEHLFKQLFPGNPFQYNFADETFDAQYQNDQRLVRLFSVFAALTIFIACLGLFGLAAFTAQQRTKEIGIRKVMGATIGSIVTLLSKDFLSLVAIAFLLAIPFAWYAMNLWLQDFAYRVHLHWWLFALPGIVALVIALLTISFQSIKAALTNPVNTLRNE